MLGLCFFVSVKDLTSEMLKHTNWDEHEGAFSTPNRNDLLSATVVVATLCYAATFFNEDVPRGHFSLVVVDEAGMAMEPEAIAPVAALLGEG